MTRYKLTVEYDGTGLLGWQRQKDGLSAQEILENGIKGFCGQAIEVYAAGRTDAGVHARGQVVHMDLETTHDTYTIRQAINDHMRDSAVVVLDVEEVDDEFHARFSAKQRHYEYHILNRSPRPVIDRNHLWHVHYKLDIPAMRQAAKRLVGTHDFTSLRATECQSKSPVKTIDRIEIVAPDESTDDYSSHITIHVSAKSFLHHMVRNIAGTLVDVGRGLYPPEKIDEILEAKDRAAAGPTAPAHALYFMRVDY